MQYNPYIYGESLKFLHSKENKGENTTVTSDFRPEVEIWQFCARAMHLTTIIGTVWSL